MFEVSGSALHVDAPVFLLMRRFPLEVDDTRSCFEMPLRVQETRFYLLYQLATGNEDLAALLTVFEPWFSRET